MHTPEQQLKALLEISKSVQKVNKSIDLENLTAQFANTLIDKTLPISTLAIHRLIDDQQGLFQSFRYIRNSLVRMSEPECRPHLFSLWKSQKAHHDPDITHSKTPQDLITIRSKFDNVQIHSLIDIPFSKGVLSVFSITPYAFPEKAEKFLSEIANILAMGLTRIDDLERIEKQIDILTNQQTLIQQSHHIQTVRQHKRVIQAVDKLAQSILSSLDLDYLLDTLSKEILNAGIFRSIMLALVDEKAENIEVVRSYQLEPVYHVSSEQSHIEIENENFHIRANQGAIGVRYALTDDNVTAKTAYTGQMQIIEHMAEGNLDHRFDNNPEHWVDKIAYFIPIKYHHRVLAVIATGSTYKEKPEILARVQALQPLFHIAAVAIEYARLYQELETQRLLSIRTDRLRSLGQMAAGMAHELNQPLQGMRGTAETILISTKRQWNLTDQDIQDHLHFIIDQADRMDRIINHVRVFANDANKPEVYPTDVHDVIDATVSLINPQFTSRDLQLIVKKTTKLPKVVVNPFSLEEVFINLLINARDAMEDQWQDGSKNKTHIPPVILATNILVQKGHQWIQIEITDRGIGIPPNIMDRLFDPFFSTKSPDRGTGLGLSISKSILDSFGAKLHIQSTPGKGTTARVTLPVASSPP